MALAPRKPWAAWLMALYVVALLSLPVDIGVGLAGAVLTPARLVLLAAVALAVFEWRSVVAALRAVPRIIWIGWAAFLGAAMITALIAPSGAAWARYGSLVGEGLVVFALIVWAASAPGGLRTMITAFALTLVVVAVAVVALAAMGLHYDHVLSGLAGSVPAPGVTPRYGLERQAGPFRGATYFGIWLTVAGAFLLPLVGHVKCSRHWLAVAAWVALLAAVILTGSRQAMAMMFALPGIYFLARGQRLIGLASLLVGAAVVVSVSLVPANEYIEYSNSARITALRSGLEAIAARPFFGWGLLSDQSVLSSISGRRSYVDNTYLSMAVETGLVGLGAFALLVAAILGTAWRGRRSPPGLALGIALAAVLGMGILVSVLQASQGYAAFFVLAAVAVAAALRAADRGPAAAPT